MFIEDEELRSLYKTASTEHIEVIERGLLHLEKHPDDYETLKVLLREAHSLKGDSRMLGVSDAETIVHQVEEVLSAVEQGRSVLTPQLCDRLYRAVDALRGIARTAVTGEPCSINVFETIVQLMGADETHAIAEGTDPSETMDFLADILPETPIPQFSLSEDSTTFLLEDNFLDMSFCDTPSSVIPLEKPEVASQQTSIKTERLAEEVRDETFHLDTLRVDSAKLDALIVQTDELSVSKLRMSRHLESLTTLFDLWEDWNRSYTTHRSSATNAITEGTTDEFQEQTLRHLREFGQRLGQLRQAYGEDAARLEIVANELEGGIRSLRMMPLGSVFSLFPRMVRDLARQQSKDIEFTIEGEDVLADKRILEEIKAPLTHLLRNAIDHGIESTEERIGAGKSPTAMLQLRCRRSGSELEIEVQDDGRGLNLEAIRATALRRNLYSEAELNRMSVMQLQSLIFAPGFSTRTTVTEISGRGVGLDVVRANVEHLKGSIQVDSIPGCGCLFRIVLSSNLTASEALVVKVEGITYAIPLEFIETLIRLPKADIFTLEGHLTFNWQEQPTSVAWLSDLLGLSTATPNSPHSIYNVRDTFACVVIRHGAEYLGLLVDDFVDRQNIILKPHNKLLGHVRNIAGSTILSNGEVCMVLEPRDLLHPANSPATAIAIERLERAIEKTQILLVEDSIPIRTQVKRILEGAGYEVTAAVDGLDGFNKLRAGTFHAIVSDVEMPNLNGLELTSRVREFSEYEELPIVLVTTLAKEEDKRRGAEVGANAYLTKGNFNQSLLLNTLRRLI